MSKGFLSALIFLSCISLPVASQAHGHHRYHGGHHHMHYKSYRHHPKHDGCVRLKPGSHQYMHVC